MGTPSSFQNIHRLTFTDTLERAGYVPRKPSQDYMNIEKILTIVQVLISIFLIVSILLQQKGAGLGSSFGGEGGAGYSTRRGAEKILFYSTVILSLAFLAIALIRIRL